jgi:hypothetical protein
MYNSVGWDAFGLVFSNLPRTKQISLSKITLMPKILNYMELPGCAPVA